MTPEQAEARKLATFLETGQVLAGTFELKEAMSRVLGILGRHHGMIRGAVMLLAEDTNELRIVASHGLDEDGARRVKYQMGEGITGRVAQTGKPVVVPQISREPMFLDRLGARKKTLKHQELSFICVPVLINRNPVGALGVDLRYKADRDYERATRFLSIIATMIAQAIKVGHLIEADKQRLLDENIHLKQELRERYDFSHIVGNSGPLRQVYEQVTQVARTNTTVLLRGESGTGKELIAHAIHYNSLRSAKPFVKVSCAALPETLLESELFGYEKGAFTGAAGRKEGRFELADGGTLFLDEVADLSPVTQPKILRVLQEGEFDRLGATRSIKVDVRIVAATNQDLAEMVKEKRFREDLYYRLNVISVRVPPLRERHEDIRVLAQHYLRVYAAKNGRKLEGFSNEALERLESYAWPGNVRELENLIERTVLLARKDRIDAEDLPEEVAGVKRPPRDAILELVGTPLTEIEQRLLDETLRITGGNKTQAAKLLGIDVRTVARKLERREDDQAEGTDRS